MSAIRDLVMAVEAALTPTSCPMDPTLGQCPHDACWLRPATCRATTREATR